MASVSNNASKPSDSATIPLLKLDSSPSTRIKSSHSVRDNKSKTQQNQNGVKAVEKDISKLSLNGKIPTSNRSTSSLPEQIDSFNLMVHKEKGKSTRSLDKYSLYDQPLFDITNLTANVAEVPQILLKNRKILEEESKVLSLDWSQDSKHIVTSLQSGHLCIWDVLSKERVYALKTPCTWVFTAAFSPSQSLIAAGGLDSKCDVYKIPRAKQTLVEIQHVAQHQSYVLSCMFTSSDHQILTTSSDTTSGLWDVESSQLIREFKGHSLDVTSLDFQKSSGHCFATGSADKQVALWDMRSGLCVQSFNSHTDEVNQVKFFPSGDAIASVSDDMTCQLFDIRMNACLVKLKRNSILFPACSLDFSLNGRLLFVGYGDHSFHVWDTLKGSHCGCMYSHENKVNVVKLSPDGSYLATGSWDQLVKLWS